MLAWPPPNPPTLCSRADLQHRVPESLEEVDAAFGQLGACADAWLLSRLPESARLPDHNEAVGDRHVGRTTFSQQRRADTRSAAYAYDIWSGEPATSLGWQLLTADRAKAAFD